MKNILFIFFVIHYMSGLAVANDFDADDQRPHVSEARKDIQESKAVITEIKSKEPFVNIQKQKVWDFEDNKNDEDIELNTDIGFLGGILNFIAMIIEAFLWFVPVIIAYYLYRYREYWLNLIHGKSDIKKQSVFPETLFGLDIRRESLPDNIEVTARQLWIEGHQREAVSLLYRGSLASLFKQFKFDLPPGSTEQDCIQQLKFSLQLNNNKSAESNTDILVDEHFNQFKALTEVWIRVAYAHRLPDDVIFNNLCKNWNLFFSQKGMN